MLADRFHVALDAVLDIIVNNKKRLVEGITPEFKILDDDWKFENKEAATPSAEYLNEKKNVH
jgi:hypothetical protein